MLIEFIRKILKARELRKVEREISEAIQEQEQEPVAPSMPEFNRDFTGFKWNGCYYMIPQEYYG